MIRHKQMILRAGFAICSSMQCAQALADVAYSAGDASFSTNFVVPAGSTVDVPIYIREFGPTSEISDGGGLFSAGFLVQQTSAGSDSDPTIVQVLRNSLLFDTTDSGSNYSDASASLYVDQSGGTLAEPATPSNGMLLIGDVWLQTSGLAGSTTYLINDFDPTAGSTQCVTYDSVELDDSIDSYQPVTFTITSVVPEPAVSLASLPLIYVVAVRRRSHQAGSARRSVN